MCTSVKALPQRKKGEKALEYISLAQVEHAEHLGRGGLMRPYVTRVYIHIACLKCRTAIVHLARVDKLLASAESDLLRIRLVHQSIEASLDRVHGVAGPGHLG